MEYNIIGLTEKGKTKFLSKLFSGWLDEKNTKQCLTFSKEELDYLIPLLQSENNGFVHIGFFPTHIKWESRDNKLY